MRILVPVDFSEESLNALHYAVGIARYNSSSVMLSHVVINTDYSTSGTMGSSKGTSMDQIYVLKMLQKLKTDLYRLENRPEYRDFISGSEVILKDSYNEIAGNIVKQEADMIVMGTKGCSGLKEVFAGSNTEHVVKRANCPVISIKGKSEFHSIKHIVFASDFEEHIPHIMERLKKFAEAHGAIIHLLNVNRPALWQTTRINRNKITHFAKKYRLKNYTVNIYNHHSEEEGVVEFAIDHGIDLIALMTHGKTRLENVFRHSISETLVNHSPLPIMTFNINMERKNYRPGISWDAIKSTVWQTKNNLKEKNTEKEKKAREKKRGE